MADGTQEAAASTAGANAQAQAQPASNGGASFSVPQGYRLVSEEDHGKLTRYEQQYQGVRPFYERASKLGIKSVEDLDRYAPAIETLSNRKIDPGALAKMFQGDDAQQQESTPSPRFDPDTLKREVSESIRREMFELEHTRAEKQSKELLDKAFAELVGDEDLNEYDKTLRRMAFERYVEQNRDLYPEDHPLAKSYYAPIGQTHTAKAVAHFRELQNKAKGQQMADMGKAALKPTKPNGTAAGGSPAQGKATPPKPGSGGPSDEELEQSFKSIRASRGRG